MSESGESVGYILFRADEAPVLKRANDEVFADHYRGCGRVGGVSFRFQQESSDNLRVTISDGPFLLFDRSSAEWYYLY